MDGNELILTCQSILDILRKDGKVSLDDAEEQFAEALAIAAEEMRDDE